MAVEGVVLTVGDADDIVQEPDLRSTSVRR